MKNFDGHASCLSGLAADSNSGLLEIHGKPCITRLQTHGLVSN